MELSLVSYGVAGGRNFGLRTTKDPQKSGWTFIWKQIKNTERGKVLYSKRSRIFSRILRLICANVWHPVSCPRGTKLDI
jgi:hypothetical protein